MDNISFSELYTQYYKRSFLFAKSYVRDEMAAEDIASESLIQLWETLKRETVNIPLALLTTILKNKALNYLKHQSVEWEAMENISDKLERDISYRIATLQACNPEEMFSSEITRILKDTLASLPEQTRRIFIMSRYEQMSVKEIAEKQQLTPKSVEYHITKSLKVLRVALKDYLPVLWWFCKPKRIEKATLNLFEKSRVFV